MYNFGKYTGSTVFRFFSKCFSFSKNTFYKKMFFAFHPPKIKIAVNCNLIILFKISKRQSQLQYFYFWVFWSSKQHFTTDINIPITSNCNDNFILFLIYFLLLMKWSNKLNKWSLLISTCYLQITHFQIKIFCFFSEEVKNFLEALFWPIKSIWFCEIRIIKNTFLEKTKLIKKPENKNLNSNCSYRQKFNRKVN